MTGNVGPSYPHDSVKRQEREEKRDRRYTAERSIACLVLFSIAHRMPSRPINSIVVWDENTHTDYFISLVSLTRMRKKTFTG
jgi:hypothetical protein